MYPKSKHEQSKTLFGFFTGFVAGGVDVISTHPFWTIKTLTQNSHSLKDISKMIIKNPLLLYNGVVTNMFMTLPLTTLRVGLSSFLEKTADDHFPNHNKYLNFLPSFTAGSISAVLNCPTELVRTIKLKDAVYKMKNVNTNLNAATSFYNISKSIIVEHGITSIFKGIQTVAMRDGIYTAGFFTGAPYFKSIFKDFTSYPTLNTISAYSTIACISSFINHPFDTIKTTQHSLKADSLLLNSSVQGDFLEACKKIVLEKGFSGFYTGYSARVTAYCLAFIVKASIIEQMSAYYDLHFTKHNDIELKGLGEYGEDKDIDWINSYFSKYTMNGLDNILHLRIKDLKLDNIKVLEGIFISQKCNNFITLLSIISNTEEKIVLVPLNLLNKHSVGLIFDKSDSNLLQINYFDSLNKSIPLELKQLIVNNINSKVSFKEIAVETQKYANCTPETIENFIFYLTGQRATQEKAIELHSKLVENALLNIESSGVDLLFQDLTRGYNSYIDLWKAETDYDDQSHNFDYKNLQLEVVGDINFFH